jgi:hypothetical protein
MFVGNAIDFDVAWEPALVANVLIDSSAVTSAVSSLQSAFPFSACICGMAVNFAIGALSLLPISVAISAFTAFTASTASTASTADFTFALARTAAMLGEKGSPQGGVLWKSS